MKHKILKGVLIAGVVLGFGSGLMHVRAHWAQHRADHRQQWAEVCAEAALRAQQPAPRTATGAPDALESQSAPDRGAARTLAAGPGQD